MDFILQHFKSLELEMLITFLLVAVAPFVLLILKEENKSKTLALSRFFFAPICTRIVLFWLVVTMISGFLHSHVVLAVLKLCVIYGIMRGARWPQWALVVFSFLGIGGGVMERMTNNAGVWTDFSAALLVGGIVNLVLFMLLVSKSATEWRNRNRADAVH